MSTFRFVVSCLLLFIAGGASYYFMKTAETERAGVVMMMAGSIIVWYMIDLLEDVELSFYPDRYVVIDNEEG